MKIDHILSLGKLKIEGKEKKDLENEFSSILDFVEKLKKLDIKSIEPMTYPVEIENVTRGDKLSKKKTDEKKAKELLDLAPIKKEKYIKVKQIL